MGLSSWTPRPAEALSARTTALRLKRAPWPPGAAAAVSSTTVGVAKVPSSVDWRPPGVLCDQAAPGGSFAVSHSALVHFNRFASCRWRALQWRCQLLSRREKLFWHAEQGRAAREGARLGVAMHTFCSSLPRWKHGPRDPYEPFVQCRRGWMVCTSSGPMRRPTSPSRPTTSPMPPLCPRSPLATLFRNSVPPSDPPASPSSAWWYGS